MIDAEIDRMTLREPLRIYTEQTSDIGGIWAFKPYAMTHVEFVEVSDYEAQRDLVAVQAAELTRLRAQVSRLRTALQTMVDSYEASSELHTSSADCAANLYDRARAALTTKGDTP